MAAKKKKAVKKTTKKKPVKKKVVKKTVKKKTVAKKAPAKNVNKSTTKKKLYRSTKDKMVGGVCGGIAEYTNSDPTLVRLLFVIAMLVTTVWPGILAYVAAMLLIPEK